MFAADTNIFVTGKNELDVYGKAQTILNHYQVHEYMASNRRHINLMKSLYMYFKPHLNQTERQMCARTKKEKSFELTNFKLKKVKISWISHGTLLMIRYLGMHRLRGGVQAFQFRKHEFDLWVGGDGLDMYQQL